MSRETLLLTGGTGSFGKSFTRRALDDDWYARIIIFSDGEARQSEMKADFPPSDKLEYFLGTVRDIDRVRSAMRCGVDVVIHAAALKEVPSCEYDWPEAVATNVDGSRNVAQAAIEHGVKQALLISTDKSVSPCTSSGLTKAMAEEWFIRLNRGSKYRTAVHRMHEELGKVRVTGHGTKLACVRYGNVLASRGSLVPLVARKQALGEPVPLTDLRMTRFWWTLDSAVTFVKQVLDEMEPGQIWVPKLGAAPVISLVQALSTSEPPVSTLNVVGIRGKEKMHEALVAPDEARHTWELPNAYVIQPANATWPTQPAAGAKRVAEDFTYTSADEDRWLTVAQLREMVAC